MKIRSVVVTGGCGFVGSRIVAHLRDKYPQCLITILDARVPESHSSDQYTKYVQADITSVSATQQALLAASPQAVIHTAGIVPALADRYHRRLEKLVFSVNVGGTQNVLRAAQEAGVEAFIFTSSVTAVVDDFSQSYANMDERWPVVEPGMASTYGESKVKAESLVSAANSSVDGLEKKSFKTCSLRLAVVFGEGDQQLIPSTIDVIRGSDQSPYRLGDGMNMWDLVYVGNAADAHVLALENLLSDRPTAAGETIFIQNNEPVSVRDFMLFMWREYNGHIPPFEVEIPVWLGRLIGAFMEAYAWVTGKPATISRGSVIDATATRYASGDKARRILGYEARVGLEEGLRRSCQYYAQTPSG